MGREGVEGCQVSSLLMSGIRWVCGTWYGHGGICVVGIGVFRE